MSATPKRVAPAPASPYAGAQQFLQEHVPTLADRAWARICASEADYGDSYLRTPRSKLVAELEEELADAAAWAALIAERLDRDPDMAGSARDRATALLAAIATASAKTDALAAQLLPLIVEAA